MDYNIFVRNAGIYGPLTKRLWDHHNTINDKEKKQIEDFFSKEIARLGSDTFETTYKAKELDESIQFAHKQIKTDNLKRKYKYFGGKSKKRKKTKKRKGTSKRRSKY